jgi:hypothetical protein
MKVTALFAVLASLVAMGIADAAAPIGHASSAAPAARSPSATSSLSGFAFDPVPTFRRFALVVGVNDGGASRIRLRYAATDAVTFSEVLTELGGVAKGDLLLLRDPSRTSFLDAMETLRVRIAEASARGMRAELLVYFSGHSDETGLIFGKERLAYGEFRTRIDAAPARIRLAVVDACASGALTRLKGGSRLPAFSVDQSSNLSGYAFLTSSSGAESAQESDRIRASFFTHYLVTGLRGGADRNQDGKVTLGEAYEFAFQETLSQTEGTQAGAQHPSYDMRLTGTGDLVLTDLRGTSAGLVLDPKLRGRIFVRAASGALVAELQKQPGRRVELGLEPGTYDVSLDQGDSLFRALIKVDTLAHPPLAFGDFEPAHRERTRSRGGSDSGLALEGSRDGNEVAFLTPAESSETDAPWIAARAAFVPSLGFPGHGAGPWSHNLSVNLFSGEARVIHGLQFSLGVNQATRELHGLQLGLLVNAGRNVTGLQISPVNQAGRIAGVQVGAMNFAHSQAGMQAGFVNWAGTLRGLQVGPLNFADTARGLQAGLFNYATHGEGPVLGLINVVGNGLHDLETTFDDRSMLRTALLLGGPYNYNYLSLDMKARYPRHLWGGSAGVGVHLPRKPVFADVDASFGMLWNDEAWDNYSLQMRLRGVVGYSPMRWFSLFAGATYNAEAWPRSQYPNLNPDRVGEPWGDDLRAFRWPGFVLGVRI